MTKIDMGAIIEETVKFINSPEGKEGIKKAIKSAIEVKERFKELMQISIETLYKPMDI